MWSSIKLIAMVMLFIASFAAKDIIVSQFLISLSIIVGLNLMRQISNNNKITVKDGD